MPSFCRLRNRLQNRPRGFSLLEVLVTIAILLIVLIILGQFMNQVDQAWRLAAADPFAEAQDAFETVCRHLADATLAPYEDFADATGAFRTGAAFIPNHLARRSDLDFICAPGAGPSGLLAASGRVTTGSAVFFINPKGYTQTDAHLGMDHLLNAMGYFVEFGGDETTPGFILPQAPLYRWRLKQVMQPAESLQIFADGTSSAWIGPLTASGASLSILAENVVTLLVMPEPAASDSTGALVPTYNYDSRDVTNGLTLNQLPPRLRVVLVAIDPLSAQRLAWQNGSTAPPLAAATLFQQAASLSTDLATLDSSLTAQKIGHRVFQRDILVRSSSWSDTPSP